MLPSAHRTSAPLPDAAHVQRSLANSFNTMVAICLETGYRFPRAHQVLAVPSATAAGDVGEPCPVAEPESSDSEEGMGAASLFESDSPREEPERRVARARRLRFTKADWEARARFNTELRNRMKKAKGRGWGRGRR